MILKKTLLGIFVLIFLFSGRSEAEENSQETEYFAPSVSHLEGEIRNNLIRLSWIDAPDVRGPVYIYRSQIPFSALLELPDPIEIAYGTGYYLYEVESPGIFHYFIAASDLSGRRYILYIPNTNIVSITVQPENVPGYLDDFLSMPSDQAEIHANEEITVSHIMRTGIEEIHARIEESRVLISFSGADISKNLILYRSLSPIRQPEDLLSAMIVRQRVRSPVIDSPLPGINYYYALVYEEDINSGLLAIRPGYNATEAVLVPPVHFGLRNIPLPGITSSAPGHPAESEILDPEIAEIAASLEQQHEENSMSGSSVHPSRQFFQIEAVIFTEDLVIGGIGEEYQLRNIVQGYFLLEEWDRAEEEFRRFLEFWSSPVPAVTVSRHGFILDRFIISRENPEKRSLNFWLLRICFRQKPIPGYNQH